MSNAQPRSAPRFTTCSRGNLPELHRNHPNAPGLLSSTSPMTHLTELPGEVIQFISSLLEDRDLFRLGFTSRYLHQNAYHLFLARMGVGAREGDVADLRSEDVRRAIRCSLFPIRLYRIILPVDIGGDATSQGTSHSFSAAALHLLEKVDRVQEVNVKIGSMSTIASGLDARQSLSQPPIHPLSPSSMEFSGWDRLMKRVLTKAQCRALLIEVDDQQCDVSSELVEEAILGGYYGVKGALNWIRLGLSKAIAAPLRWFGLDRSSGLEVFRIHSPILFHPTLCHWTLFALRQSSLASISLDHLQAIEQETWGLLLPLISIPSLTKLSINLCSIPTEDLYTFLSRHPRLEELSLGPNLTPLNPNAILPKKALCKLRSLTGTAEQLVVLLSGSTPLPTLDALKMVRVLYRTRRGSKSLAASIDNDLAPICFRLRSMDTVVLSVLVETTATDWVVLPSPGNRGHFAFPEPTLDEQTNGHQAGPSSMQMWSSFDSRLTSTMTFTGSCVTHLEFRFNIFVLPAAMVTALPKWLSTFDKMERFELWTASVTLDSNIPKARRQTSRRGGRRTRYGLPWEEPHHEDAFLDGLLKNCPCIKMVCVNGEVLEEAPVARRPKLKRLV